jgi:hypothetical protein
VKAAPLTDAGVILATTVDPARFPAGVRAGIGAADSPDRSWRQARTALRFTTPRQPVVHHDDLGALALLASTSPSPPDSHEPDSPSPHGDSSTTKSVFLSFGRLLDFAPLAA